MKREIFGTIALFSWVPFLLNLGRSWPGLWGFILCVLGLAALYCTLDLLTVERESKKWLHATGSPWTTCSLFVWMVFGWIAHKLSLYWSLLVPLLAILITYGMARLWPEPKREDQLGDSPEVTDFKRAE